MTDNIEALLAIFIGIFIIYGGCLIYELKAIRELLKRDHPEKVKLAD